MSDDETAQAIDRFWQAARVAARQSTLGGVLSESPSGVVAPPAFAFGDSPELADELLGLVLAGTKTATAELLSIFEASGEPVPVPGDLWIVLDGAGEPKALIRTTAVDTVPFDQVAAEFAYLEGEEPRTLESWRADHERYWRRNMPEGQEFTPDALVVCERFALLHPRP